MYGLYLVEIWRYGSIFVSLIVWIYLYSSLHSDLRKKSDKIVRYGRSRSFKVSEIGIDRKPVCDFVLVANITHRFRDIATK